MKKIEQRGGTSNLSRGGLEKLGKILKRAEYWSTAYVKAAGDVLGLLESLDVNQREAEKFILDLARVDMDSGSHFGILPATMQVLERLRQNEITFDKKISQLLLDSIAVDDNSYFNWNDDRRERLIRALISYARVGRSEGFENRTEAICQKIIQAIKASNGPIGVDARTNLVSQRFGSSGVNVPVEYFSCREQKEYFSENRIVLVRVGHLLFIDETFRRFVSQEILENENTIIIFVPDIDETEFGGSLGYFTCNTIASLITANRRGLAFLDCGTGSGILSLAALGLGSAKVLGVDNDPEEIKKAHKLALANGYDEGCELLYVEADLQNQCEVVERMRAFVGAGPVGIISNLGYWPDYPISNVTNLAYLSALGEAGLYPSLFVGGGYGGKEAHFNEEEIEFLERLGVSRSRLPQMDVCADKLILAKLGFSIECFSESEPKIRSSFRAGSLVATRPY